MHPRFHGLIIRRTRRAQFVQVGTALVLLCASLALATFAPPAQASSILFGNDFEADATGAFPADWTYVSGSWSVQQDSSHVLAQTNTDTSTEKRVLAGSISWTDYELKADVRPGANSPALGLQVLARYTDSSNYYSFGLYSNTWYLKKRVSGTQVTLATGGFTYTSQFYTVSLSLQGKTLTAAIGGTTLATVTDSSLTGGMIGMSTKAASEIDNVLVSGSGVPPTPTPTATTTTTPTPTATTTAPPTPTPTPPPSGSGNGHLTVNTDTSGNVSVTSLDDQQNGWQVVFNQTTGGAITSNSEIDSGRYTELEAQNANHGRLQFYLQTSGNVYISNLDNPGSITILRNTSELVGIQTVSTDVTYHIRWTTTYYVWPAGEVYMAMTVANIGTSALALSSYQSMEIDLGGLPLSTFTNTVNQAWYEVSSAAYSPIPKTTFSQESAQFGHNPMPSTPLTLGLLMDKYTTWSSQGIANAGGDETKNTFRAKDQWFGYLSKFAAGASVTFTLLYDQRRNLTQSQSLAIDADYRSPEITVSTGALATTDTEPSTMSLTNGYNRYTGDYVVKTTDNHVTAQLDTSKVQTRFTPRFKFTGWTKGEPTLTWGNTTLTAGTDYTYVLDADSTTLYVQLNFDVVSSGPSSGQRVNAPLTIA